MKEFLKVLLIIQVFCFISFAQEPQEKEATKQQTMDWIADKIKKNLQRETRDGRDVTFVSYDGKVYVLSGVFKYNGDRGTLTVDLTKITAAKNTENGISLSGRGFAQLQMSGYTTKPSNALSIPNDYIAWRNEPNLRKKMVKAFQTLAEYNNAEKPKEMF